jgi:hypothetical protein
MLARCMPLLADPNRMRDIGHAALNALLAEPRTDPDRIAGVGYGTGGAWWRTSGVLPAAVLAPGPRQRTGGHKAVADHGGPLLTWLNDPGE